MKMVFLTDLRLTGKPLALAVLALLGASLACTTPIGTPIPSAATEAPSAVPPSSTPRPTATAAATATEAEAAQVAVVRAAMVNVRAEPNGEVVGQLLAGTDVRVIGCVDDWCEVETDQMSGYIFIGCLSIAEGKGCSAK